MYTHSQSGIFYNWRLSQDDILTLEPPPCDKRLAYGIDLNQFGDLRLPDGIGHFPLVLNVHGGFWRAAYDLAHAGHFCAALTRSEFLEYRISARRR